MSSETAQYRPQRSLFSQQLDSEEERAERVDFKMVTFSLAGKDYGIDIMKVKEIAKFSSYTYVPNTPPFVAGVYNLRGDIISIIDLRIMLNLPATRRDDDQPDDGLILRLDAGLIGIIVDSIDRVVGISSESIQPPHPIFADINLKYISGVVEHEQKLYIILDAERVLGKDAATESPSLPPPAPSIASSEGAIAAGVSGSPSSDAQSNVAKDFIRQTLSTFRGFHATKINERWFNARFEEWKSTRSADRLQLQGESDAVAFLDTFYSPYSNRFWSAEYTRAISDLLPEDGISSLTVWNPGCGQGYESYSLACLLRERYPEARIKIWASDNDLLNVSTAPSLVFSPEEAPEQMQPYLVEGKNGYSFGQEIRDLILFEFSDALHAEGLPPVDLIVARDVLSFLAPESQHIAQQRIYERTKGGGLVVVGANEELDPQLGLEPVRAGDLTVYRK